MGLKPGNPDGTYVQKVPLVGFQATKVQGSFQVGGKAIPLEFPRNFVAVPGKAGEQPEVKDSEVVFVGYGVVAPEYGWDDYKGLDVRGKTLIMLVGDPPVPDPKDSKLLDPAVFKGRAMTYYGRWTYKYEIAREAGRGGGDPGPRDRAGRLSVLSGPGVVEPRELRHRPAGRSRLPSRP